MNKEEQVYNKLIRDKIPEIIEKEDIWRPIIKKLDDKKYIKELKKKIVEEAKELNKAEDKKEIINELADIKEIIDTLIEYYDLEEEKIEQKQKDKRKKRGGLERKLFLVKNIRK